VHGGLFGESGDLFLNPVGKDVSPESGLGGEVDDHGEREAEELEEKRNLES